MIRLIFGVIIVFALIVCVMQYLHGASNSPGSNKRVRSRQHKNDDDIIDIEPVDEE